MKVLVFGSTGFLGSKIQKHFEECAGVSIRKENWQNAIPKNSKIWINCIGKAHDHKNEATEQDFYLANYEIVKEIFSAFITSEANLFIHISSIAAVEEFSAEIPLTEKSASNSVSHYGKSKKKAEDRLLEQKLPTDKKVIILRPPMIHGEGDKGSLRLLYQTLSKGIPYPLAAFENQRSFVSADNLIFLIEKIIENKDALEGGIYNACDDGAISTNQIIDIIKKVENKNIPKIALPKALIKGLARFGDMVPVFPLNTKKLEKMTSNLLVSNQKIKTALKIEKLHLSAEEGLEKTIRSFAKK